MNLKSINIYSLIITISPKKGIDASVNIPFKSIHNYPQSISKTMNHQNHHHLILEEHLNPD